LPPRLQKLLFLFGFLFFVVAAGSTGRGTSYSMSATYLVSSSSTDGCALSRASVGLLLSGNGWESGGKGEQSSKTHTRYHFGFLRLLSSRTWDDAIPTIKPAIAAIVWQKQHRRPSQPAPHEACVTAALNRIDGSGSLARAVERNTEWVPCRCRLHGGASPGAPRGQANGMWRHGLRSAEVIERRRAMTTAMRMIRQALA
jgi:hypothetical protein